MPSTTPNTPVDNIKQKLTAFKESEHYLKVASVALYPAGKWAFTFPTQPMARVMFEQQAKGSKLLPTIKSMFLRGGMLTFFRGGVSSANKEFVGALAKGPVLAYSQKWTKDYILPHHLQHDFMVDLVAGNLGGPIAATSTQIFERYKVWVNTNQFAETKPNIQSFAKAIYRVNAGQPVNFQILKAAEELGRGFGAHVIKQNFMITTLLLSNTATRKALKEHKKENPKSVKFVQSFLPAFVVGVISVPFDVIKTIIQKEVGKKTSIRDAIKLIMTRDGTGAFAGWQMKCALTTAGYIFTGFFLDHVKDLQHEAELKLKAKQEAQKTFTTSFDLKKQVNSVDELTQSVNALSLQEQNPNQKPIA